MWWPGHTEVHHLGHCESWIDHLSQWLRKRLGMEHLDPSSSPELLIWPVEPDTRNWVKTLG